MGFPDKPEELEEVLISPIILFMTIRDLPVCGQTKGGKRLSEAVLLMYQMTYHLHCSNFLRL